MEVEIAEALKILGSIVVALATYYFGRRKSKLETEKIELENEKLRIDIQNGKLKEGVHIQKLNFYDDVLKLVFVNAIQDSVKELFKNTSADRFLILIARNGKTELRYADVILDFYKDPNHQIDAVRIYTNVELDDPYKEMLRLTEKHGFFDIETATMPDQILKHFYMVEDVKHGRTMPIARLPIDEDNDFLIYTSVAKHLDVKFTEMEKTYFELIHNNSFRPNVKKLLKVA